MIKRFRWVFVAVVAGAILWLILPKGGGGHEDKSERAQSRNNGEAQPLENSRRESSRRKSGDPDSRLPTPLEKKVAAQEQLVKDKRTALLELARARAPIIPPPGQEAPPPEDTEAEAERQAQAAQKFEDARLELNEDRKMLEELKLELAEEQKNSGGK